MSTQPERVSVEQLLQRLQHAEDAYGERLAAETEQLRAENEKLRALVQEVRGVAFDFNGGGFVGPRICYLIDESGLLGSGDEEQTP